MHSHHIAHLDISIRNLLTDYRARYAYIDFELSRRFEGIPDPRIRCRRGTEVAPELERGDFGDPYKADIWSLATLMTHASAVSIILLSTVRMSHAIQYEVDRLQRGRAHSFDHSHA